MGELYCITFILKYLIHVLTTLFQNVESDYLKDCRE